MESSPILCLSLSTMLWIYILGESSLIPRGISLQFVSYLLAWFEQSESLGLCCNLPITATSLGTHEQIGFCYSLLIYNGRLMHSSFFTPSFTLIWRLGILPFLSLYWVFIFRSLMVHSPPASSWDLFPPRWQDVRSKWPNFIFKNRNVASKSFYCLIETGLR